MGIEEHIWIVTNEGFSFQNWLNEILIYGIIFFIDRPDTMKYNSEMHVFLFWWDRQVSSHTCQEDALIRGCSEKAKVYSVDLVPLKRIEFCLPQLCSQKIILEQWIVSAQRKCFCFYPFLFFFFMHGQAPICGLLIAETETNYCEWHSFASQMTLDLYF